MEEAEEPHKHKQTSKQTKNAINKGSENIHRTVSAEFVTETEKV